MSATYKTLKKTHVATITQPFTYKELDKNGKLKRKRQVQYVEYLDSIFVDEQIKVDPNPKITYLYIRKQTIRALDQRMEEMLDIHPDNEANGGRLFKKVDVEKEETFQLEAFKKLDKVKNYIMQSDENAVRAAAIYFVNPTFLNKSETTLRIKLRSVVELSSSNPSGSDELIDKLIAHFEEKNNEEKLVITIALKENIIKTVGGKKIVWADSKETIYIAAQQKDALKDFAIYLKTDKDGRQVLSAISQKVKAIKK